MSATADPDISVVPNEMRLYAIENRGRGKPQEGYRQMYRGII